MEFPVLFTSTQCHWCTDVKQWLNQTGLYNYVIVLDVDKDTKAMSDLKSFHTNGGVPTLVYGGRYLAGDANQVIRALQNMFASQRIA